MTVVALPQPQVKYRRMQVAELVGIPYLEKGRSMQGADCWGVCLIAARHLFDLDLPEYFYSEADMLDEAAVLIGQETKGPRWSRCELALPRGAVHIFRIKGFETHCGLSLGGGNFLHSMKGRNSCVESIHAADWRQRCTGTYAWTP